MKTSLLVLHSQTHSPVRPNSCLHTSCLDGEGTGLFPTSSGLYNIGVLNIALLSDFGVQALFNSACAGDVGVPTVDLNILSVGVHGVLAWRSFSRCGVHGVLFCTIFSRCGVHGVLFCTSLSRCCFGPVMGVLAARSNLFLGVEGVFGVFGV